MLTSFLSYAPISGDNLPDLNYYDNTDHIAQIPIPSYLVDFFYNLKNEGFDIQILKKICSKNFFKSIDKILLSYDYLSIQDDNDKNYLIENKEIYNTITSFILEKNVTDIICDYKTEIEYVYVFNKLELVYELYFGKEMVNWIISVNQINFFSDDFNLYYFKRILSNKINLEYLFNDLSIDDLTKNRFSYMISLINITEDIFDYIHNNYSEYINYYKIFEKNNFLEHRIYDNIEKIEFYNIIKLLKQYPLLNRESIIEKFNFDTQLTISIINNDIILSEDFFYNNEVNIDDSVYSLFSSKVQLSENFIRLYDDKVSWEKILDKKYLSRHFLKMYKERVFDYYFQEHVTEI